MKRRSETVTNTDSLKKIRALLKKVRDSNVTPLSIIDTSSGLNAQQFAMDYMWRFTNK